MSAVAAAGAERPAILAAGLAALVVDAFLATWSLRSGACIDLAGLLAPLRVVSSVIAAPALAAAAAGTARSAAAPASAGREPRSRAAPGVTASRMATRKEGAHHAAPSAAPPSSHDVAPPAGAPARRWLTAPEVATHLGVSTSTIQHWSAAGTIPCIRLPGRLVRYDRAAIDAWAASYACAPLGRARHPKAGQR